MTKFSLGLAAMLAAIFACIQSGAQTTGNGEVISKDNYKLNVLKVLPDQYPKVSVFFKAEDENHNPVWNLDKNNVSVTENNISCDIQELHKITDEKPIILHLIVDNSGSMGDVYGLKSKPIAHAKTAILTMLKELNIGKDKITLIGFNNKSTQYLNYSNDIHSIKNAVYAMKADGGTAFYDALAYRLNSIDNSNTNNIHVVIALTDGDDNASKSGVKTVIKSGKKKDIPVYIIGLGNVKSAQLKKICKELNGTYYSASDANKLSSIYQHICRKVQAVYELRYLSKAADNLDTNMHTRIDFKIDSIQLSDNWLDIEMPEKNKNEIKERIAQLEKQKRELEAQKAMEAEREERKKKTIGLITIAVIAGAGSFYVFKKANAPIKTTFSEPYPNPSNGEFKIDYKLGNSGNYTAKVFSLNGTELQSYPVENNRGSIDFDLSWYNNGTYVIQISDASGPVSSSKIVVNK